MSVLTATLITQIRGIIKDLLNTSGRDAFVYDTDASFTLSQLYVSSATISVYLNGTAVSSDDWSYSSVTNKITIAPITSGVVLTKNDNIIITYSYYEKYSDTEITSYIKSSLMYFTKFKYAKTFYMNTNNQVITRNGVQPTDDEGDLIALVTAINIDPQNIRIRMPDFTIDAPEKKSKSEQIQEVISSFGKSYGIVDYLEDGET